LSTCVCTGFSDRNAAVFCRGDIAHPLASVPTCHNVHFSTCIRESLNLSLFVEGQRVMSCAYPGGGGSMMVWIGVSVLGVLLSVVGVLCLVAPGVRQFCWGVLCGLGVAGVLLFLVQPSTTQRQGTGKQTAVSWVPRPSRPGIPGVPS